MHFQSDHLEQEARQDREHIQLLISNYQALVESLKKRDDIVQKQLDRQDTRLARHRKYLDNHQEDIKQIVADQVCMVQRMTGYKEKACHCGEDSGRLSQLSYQEPLVASSSGPLFPSEGSPEPIPVPPPAVVGDGPEFPLSPSSSSDSDKENSNEGSFQSTPLIVTELVEIREVQDEEAQALSDAMDEEVRSRLFQRCRSKNHPERFHPYPKGWQNGVMDMVIFRTIFFELLVFFTFTILTINFAY